MEPLSQSKSKLFASLLHKKYRYKHSLFIAEGAKCVQEALQSQAKVMGIVLKEGSSHLITPQSATLTYLASPEQFSKLTDQPNPEGIMAILQIPDEAGPLPEDQPAVFLDSLQDPGNVGAILRVADWFGIRHMIAGPGTVDLYHPKVVRASMGSIFRMNLHTISSADAFIADHHQRLAIADLEGTSLTSMQPEKAGILVIGNEANGVSDIFRSDERISKIRIPGGDNTESLNAAVAAGIMIWEWQKP